MRQLTVPLYLSGTHLCSSKAVTCRLIINIIFIYVKYLHVVQQAVFFWEYHKAQVPSAKMKFILSFLLTYDLILIFFWFLSSYCAHTTDENIGRLNKLNNYDCVMSLDHQWLYILVVYLYCRDEHSIIFQRLLQLLPQSWRRLDMVCRCVCCIISPHCLIKHK